MELTHRFTVPAGIDATWAAFEDVEQLAACFPGATITGVEGETFTGTCKVKLGPIALVYGGSGTFVSRDRDAGTFRVEAKGKDKRGNGTAGATVLASFSDQGESTEVEVRTDLAITGKPAQFGRGVMQDVSDKLLNQFVACLQEKVGDRIDEAAAAAAPAVTPPPPPPPRPASPTDDAVDLGAAVLPVLARTYGPKLLVGLVVLYLLKRLLGRRTKG
ncbi:MAG: SRPBCC family protein [Nocardioides sp.]|nr:SRPBCC family protein [Nocardioides sp.]